MDDNIYKRKTFHMHILSNQWLEEWLGGKEFSCHREKIILTYERI